MFVTFKVHDIVFFSYFSDDDKQLSDIFIIDFARILNAFFFV